LGLVRRSHILTLEAIAITIFFVSIGEAIIYYHIMPFSKGITPPKLKRITPRVDTETHRQFMAMAQAKGLTASELCRRLLQQLIAAELKTPAA
jgi:hypothetical protein